MIKFVSLVILYIIAFENRSRALSVSTINKAFSVNLTPDALICQIFDEVDTNAYNIISIGEARNIFTRINNSLFRSYTSDQVDNFFRALDTNGDGVLSFSEFRRAFEEARMEKEVFSSKPKRKMSFASNILPSSVFACPIGEECTIDEIFEQMDKDGDGQITKAETAKTLLRLNSVMRRSYGQDELDIFFSALDRNRKGSISIGEFKKAFNEGM